MREDVLPRYWGDDPGAVTTEVLIGWLVRCNADVDGRVFNRPQYWAERYPLQSARPLVTALNTTPTRTALKEAYLVAAAGGFHGRAVCSLLDTYLTPRRD